MIHDIYIVKVPKQGIFNISILILVATFGLIFMINLLISDVESKSDMFIVIFAISIFISTIFIIPIFFYLTLPKKICFSDFDITLINRLNKIQIISKNQIYKIKVKKDLIDKKKIFNLYYDKSKPDYCINFDEDSGKLIWDWYHHEGDWKKEDMK